MTEDDEQVARLVMGWEWKAGAKIHPQIPPYTTDASADFTVLVKVRETWDAESQRRFRVAYAQVIVERMKTGRASGSSMFMYYEKGDWSHAALAVLKAQQEPKP